MMTRAAASQACAVSQNRIHGGGEVRSRGSSLVLGDQGRRQRVKARMRAARVPFLRWRVVLGGRRASRCKE